MDGALLCHRPVMSDRPSSPASVRARFLALSGVSSDSCLDYSHSRTTPRPVRCSVSISWMKKWEKNEAFFLLIPLRAHFIGPVSEAGMLHMAGQLGGVAQGYQGQDPRGLSSQPCPTTVEMSPPWERDFFLSAWIICHPAVHHWFADDDEGRLVLLCPQQCLSRRGCPASVPTSDQIRAGTLAVPAGQSLAWLAQAPGASLGAGFQFPCVGNHYPSVDISDSDVSLCQTYVDFGCLLILWLSIFVPLHGSITTESAHCTLIVSPFSPHLFSISLPNLFTGSLGFYPYCLRQSHPDILFSNSNPPSFCLLLNFILYFSPAFGAPHIPERWSLKEHCHMFLICIPASVPDPPAIIRIFRNKWTLPIYAIPKQTTFWFQYLAWIYTVLVVLCVR